MNYSLVSAAEPSAMLTGILTRMNVPPSSRPSPRKQQRVRRRRKQLLCLEKKEHKNSQSAGGSLQVGAKGRLAMMIVGLAEVVVN